MYASYKKEDPPPHRVKPIPISVIRHVLGVDMAIDKPNTNAIARMIVLAFFFLLRPGEYTAGPSTTSSFTLADVQLFIGDIRLDIKTASVATLLRAAFCILEFTNKKNGVRWKVIGLGRSGSTTLCPVRVIVARVIHLRTHNAPAAAPLSHYFHKGKWNWVKPADITLMLRNAVAIMGHSVGFNKEDISARSLRAAGAMSLLCANIDHDRIKLVGRWRSDEMLRYLHVQASPVMRHFAKAMIADGDFNLIPNQRVVNTTVPLH